MQRCKKLDLNLFDITCRLESLTSPAFRFTLAPYDTDTATTRRTTSSINIESTTTAITSIKSSTADTKTVASQVQKRVQACFLTGKC